MPPVKGFPHFPIRNLRMISKSLSILPIVFALTPVRSAEERAFPAWRVEPEVSAPSSILVRRASGGADAYLYVKISLKNSTGASRAIAPYVELTTDTNKAYAAVHDPSALEIVRLRDGKDVVDLFDVSGEIEDGGTMTLVALFRAVDPVANHYTIRIQGLAAGLVRKGGDFLKQRQDYIARFHRAGNEHRVVSSRFTRTEGKWELVSSKKVR